MILFYCVSEQHWKNIDVSLGIFCRWSYKSTEKWNKKISWHPSFPDTAKIPALTWSRRREGVQAVPPTHWDARGVCFLLSATGGYELTVREIIYLLLLWVRSSAPRFGTTIKDKNPPQNWKNSPPFSFAWVIKWYFFVRVPTLKHTLIILVIITCRAAFHVTWARLESKSQPLCEIHLILVLKHSYFQMIQSTCSTGSWGRKIPYSSQNGRRNFLAIPQNYSLATYRAGYRPLSYLHKNCLNKELLQQLPDQDWVRKDCPLLPPQTCNRLLP